MKVLIGLSGGVDSAVAAYLLMKEGHEVTACFMRNWDALANNDYLGNPTINNNQCPQEKDYDDAVAVAKKLGIELLRVDYIKEYWDNVFTYLIKEYECGIKVSRHEYSESSSQCQQEEEIITVPVPIVGKILSRKQCRHGPHKKRNAHIYHSEAAK